ncbi:MAG: hypothetical protein IAE83_11945 [Anaerolinea sp.]|nr:hypothetical protein [Anaerolinea sp.]CAG0945413.1 hypothetical protein ANRL1_02329 [Anaerolineae bacterium]
MNTTSLHQVLSILSWSMVTILSWLLLLIARMYYRVSRRRTYYLIFAVPPLIVGVGAARYAVYNQLGGDLVADAFWSGGTLLLALHTARLCWMMLRTKKEPS